MADIEGDMSKQPPECNSMKGQPTDCPNLIETNPTDMSGERYRCDVCGRSFYLDYEEMR